MVKTEVNQVIKMCVFIHAYVNLFKLCIYVKAKSSAVTSDAWTDPRMKAFFGLTAHTIDDDWNAKSYLLGCNRIHGHHTAPNIFSSYQTVTNKFQLNDKLLTTLPITRQI